MIFFNMAHAAMKFDFELDEGFSFCCADEEDNGRKCDQWNTLCSTKLKEVVASV